MQSLEYQTPSRRASPTPLSLWILPVAATGVAFVSVANGVNEPFAAPTVRDVAIFAGSPLFIVASLITWLVLALGRAVPRLAIILIVVWLLLMTYASLDSLHLYYQDLHRYSFTRAAAKTTASRQTAQ